MTTIPSAAATLIFVWASFAASTPSRPHLDRTGCGHPDLATLQAHRRSAVGVETLSPPVASTGLLGCRPRIRVSVFVECVWDVCGFGRPGQDNSRVELRRPPAPVKDSPTKSRFPGGAGDAGAGKEQRAAGAVESRKTVASVTWSVTTFVYVTLFIPFEHPPGTAGGHSHLIIAFH
eukprot:1195616-Prorocentrum_minimum.AAC.1